MLLIDDELLL